MLITLAAVMALIGLDEVQITDMKPGQGTVAVEAGDIVTVHYKGTLADGKVFDESKGKAPFAFKIGVKDVIDGWDKGVLGMKVGGVRRLVIPPSLAYGDKDLGVIPPNSTLTFEIELLRVDKKDKPAKLEVRKDEAGEGTAATAESTVCFHYTGSFLNGKEFDSSRKREPLTLPIKRLIPGMREALTGMKAGGKKTVVVPFNLGYGEKGIPNLIPRYATLVFEFELLEVK